MQIELRACEKCKKVFAGASGQSHCTDCESYIREQMERVEEAIDRWHLETPEEIAMFAGAPVDEIKALIDESGLLERQLDRRPRCKRCHKSPAQAESQFCLACRLDLNKGLGLAADEVVSRIREAAGQLRAPSRPYSREATTMGSMRQRIGTRIGSLTPKNRWS